MIPFRLWEMAKRTAMAHTYIAALQALCRGDFSDVLILADLLSDSGDELEHFVRSAVEYGKQAAEFHANRLKPPFDELTKHAQAFHNAWRQFQQSMTERQARREEPYIISLRMDKPVFYYTMRPRLGSSIREFYVYFEENSCQFYVESQEAGRTRKVSPQDVDEYILRCALAFKLARYVSKSAWPGVK